jgi:hypothetical protein
MAKLRLDGAGTNSEFLIINNANENNIGAGGIITVNANVTAAQMGGGGANIGNVCGLINELEVTNNHTLEVVECRKPLIYIEVNTGGVINFNNICPFSDTQTQINVGPNSTMILAGQKMNLDMVVLDSGSIFNFVHADIDFNIQMPGGLLAPLVVNDIHHLAELCMFLSNQDFGNKDFHLPLNHSHALKLYEENKELVDIMLINNLAAIKHGNFVNAGDTIFNIEKYINTHFFELICVKKFINSPNEVFSGALPKNVVEEIGSYIDFDDIN